jgi:type IV pilus assembly protein PilW
MQRITHARQRGFTLIELMIATTVATFLLGGVFYSLQSTRNAYTQQTGLAQLQDNVRLSMALITNSVETAGYFPNPLTNSAVAQFAVAAPFTTAGQAIAGTGSAAAPGDTITIRYASGQLNDNAMNCLGRTNSSGAVQLMTNKFSVNAANQLICTYNGTDYPLITSGVQNMQIVYGVKRVGGTGTCTDTYLKSTEMTATDWNVICSVRVSLTFDNPLKRTGVGPQTITITRVIGVMSTAGVNT